MLEADRGGSSLTYRPPPPMPLLPFVSPDTSLKHHRFAAGDVVLFFAGRPKIAGARGAKKQRNHHRRPFSLGKRRGPLAGRRGAAGGEQKKGMMSSCGLDVCVCCVASPVDDAQGKEQKW